MDDGFRRVMDSIADDFTKSSSERLASIASALYTSMSFGGLDRDDIKMALETAYDMGADDTLESEKYNEGR